MAMSRPESRGGIRAGIARRFRLPFRSEADVDDDANEELQAFLDARIAALISHGMSQPEARAEALRRLGHSFTDAARLLKRSARTRERRLTVRDFLDDFTQDVRYALRTLRRDYTFTLVALLIVGLGIGACVTVFSITNRVLIRPLPFQSPDELAWIANSESTGLSGETTQANTLRDMTERSRAFRDIGAYVPFFDIDNAKLTTNGERTRLTVVQVTGNFFPVLGVMPMLGRSFTDEESGGPRLGTAPAGAGQSGDDGGSDVHAALLSFRAWERRFAADPAIVGRALVLDNAPVTIVGVLPPSFDFGSIFRPGTQVDAFIPIPLSDRVSRSGNLFSMVGRLQPTSSVDAAAREVTAIAAQIKSEDARRNVFIPTVVSLKEHVSGRVRPALLILLLSVGVVMLIVCANLSNLLLARGSTREKEVALRVALGAGRGRLVRQRMTESTVLAVCGAALGLLLAVAGTRAIAGLGAFDLPMLEHVSIDGTAFVFTAVLTILAGIAVGLAPALHIPTAGISSALKSSGRGVAGDRAGQWTRNTLVVAEVALASVLLVAAGLLARSLYNVLDVDLGFEPQRVAAVRVDPDRERDTSASQFSAYVDEVLAKARALPGVDAAGLSDGLPMTSNRSWGAGAVGVAYTEATVPSTFVRIMSDGYLATIGMRLVSGRDFTARDDSASERVIIINESLARTLWPGVEAIGRLLISDTTRRVVGVVHDARQLAVDERAGNEIFIPYRQSRDFGTVNLVVRSALPPAALTAALRVALQQVVPDLPTKEFRTLSGVVDHSLSPRRFTTAMSSGFALFAVVLALLGIVGVVSYGVNQRAQEIGVRMALGASASELQWGIVRSTLKLALVGMVIGTAAAWGVTRWMGSVLFGVSATDPWTFAGVLLALGVVAMVSGYLPARRVSRIDPLVALRSTS